MTNNLKATQAEVKAMKAAYNAPRDDERLLFPLIDEFVRCYVDKAGNSDWENLYEKARKKVEVHKKVAWFTVLMNPYVGEINSIDDCAKGYTVGCKEVLFRFLEAARKQARCGERKLGMMWYSVNDRTPAVDEEVIALDGIGRISFAHIVADRKNIVNYDGWNISDVAFWMPYEPSEDMNEFYEQK